MGNIEQKKENNQTILDLVSWFSPNRLSQEKEIVKILYSESLKEYFQSKTTLSKEQLITTLIELRADATTLVKEEELFQQLSGIANRLLANKAVDLKEVLEYLSSKSKEYKEIIIKRKR